MSSPRQPEVRDNHFYKFHYQKFIKFLFIAIAIMLGCATFAMYQVTHRPLPPFAAISQNGKQLNLVPYDEPNHLPPTLIKWASKAAVAAYTFNFANYQAQLELARPYFTEAGWKSYQNAIAGVIDTIVKGQLFVNGVVNGPPVISTESVEAGGGYSWQIQLPFLVATQSAEATTSKNYLVILKIVKVPTDQNKEGIGIEQFIMTNY